MSAASAPSPYDAATLRHLNALTAAFYRREAASFSATRQTPWHGWEKALSVIGAAGPDLFGAPLRLLDLGCGNLRFERFLAEREVDLGTVVAVDNCEPLVAQAARGETVAEIAAANAPSLPHSLDFRSFDLVESLLDGTFEQRLPRNSCDLAVTFGLMHHLADPTHRSRLLAGLLRSLRPGGFAVLSFWQFLNEPRLAAKAAETTAEGRDALGLSPFRENDFLLGWQHAEGVYRFCHHAPEEEIDGLLAAVSLPLRELTRFSADGKHGNLNRYVVLQRPQC